jgi:hypothetical protein
MTAAEAYFAKADEWNELSRSVSDPSLRAAYIVLAIAYRKLGTRIEQLSSLDAHRQADKT